VPDRSNGRIVKILKRRLSSLKRRNCNDNARWYDSATGRFWQQDPIGFSAGDGNLYRYVGNGPTNYTDPSGLVDTSGFDQKKGTTVGSVIMVRYKDKYLGFTVIDPAATQEEMVKIREAQLKAAGGDPSKIGKWENSSAPAVTGFDITVEGEVHLDPKTNKCAPRFKLFGYLFRLIAPQEDPRWKDATAFPGLPADATPQQAFDRALAHEGDHWKTFATAAGIINNGLAGEEKKEYDTREDALKAVERGIARTAEIRKKAAAHSDTFDTPERRSGNQYKKFPFTEKWD
jgi:hypothetical protein